MISLNSSLTDSVFSMSELDEELKTFGFHLSDNWDYEHGYYDYLLADDEGYHFLRIPFTVTTGTLDSPDDNSLIRISEPFVLSHIYQDGLDDQVKEGNFRAVFDQFQEPKDKDGKVPEQYIQMGRELLSQVEHNLSSKRGKED